MATDPYFQIPAISQSSLKVFLKSPAEYHYQVVLGNGNALTTSSTSLGSLAHCMLLEASELDARYRAYDERLRPEPDKTMASTLNKNWKADFASACEQAGVTAVADSMWLQADAMVQNLCSTPSIAQYFFPDNDWLVQRELGVLWKNPVADLQLKSKLDVLLVDEQRQVAIVVDYKTTSCSTKEDFKWSVKKYGYDVQAAFYRDAALSYLKDNYPDSNFGVIVYFVPQKSTPPYQLLGIFQLDDRAMDTAKATYEAALVQLAGCYESNNWESNLGVELLQISKPLDDFLDADVELELY